ncbi:MAG TPA: alpha/beta fold hydrolase [Vicinamibacterales bacterium]|nr:alpha/beta fold hydrolase [Vicinamibacterales bacterium]
MTRRGCTAVLLAAALVGAAFAQSRVVTLSTDDGASLSAAVYEPFDRPSPAIILLHMLGRSRRDWDDAANRLRNAGFFVLALDFRWIDPSTGGQGFTVLLHDVRAALEYVKARPEVIPGRIGIAGASLGANVAALAAAEDPAVKALALISPSLDYRGLRAEAPLRKYGNRHLLLVAAAGDPYARRSSRELAAGGANRELIVTETVGHGTMLLAREPALVDRLVDWFQRTLL